MRGFVQFEVEKREEGSSLTEKSLVCVVWCVVVCASVCCVCGWICITVAGATFHGMSSELRYSYSYS